MEEVEGVEGELIHGYNGYNNMRKLFKCCILFALVYFNGKNKL